MSNKLRSANGILYLLVTAMYALVLLVVSNVPEIGQLRPSDNPVLWIFLTVGSLALTIGVPFFIYSQLDK